MFILPQHYTVLIILWSHFLIVATDKTPNDMPGMDPRHVCMNKLDNRSKQAIRWFVLPSDAELVSCFYLEMRKRDMKPCVFDKELQPFLHLYHIIRMTLYGYLILWMKLSQMQLFSIQNKIHSCDVTFTVRDMINMIQLVTVTNCLIHALWLWCLSLSSKCQYSLSPL